MMKLIHVYEYLKYKFGLKKKTLKLIYSNILLSWRFSPWPVVSFTCLAGSAFLMESRQPVVKVIKLYVPPSSSQRKQNFYKKSKIIL